MLGLLAPPVLAEKSSSRRSRVVVVAREKEDMSIYLFLLSVLSMTGYYNNALCVVWACELFVLCVCVHKMCVCKRKSKRRRNKKKEKNKSKTKAKEEFYEA